MSYSTLFKLNSSDIHSEAEVETRLLQPLFQDLGYPQTKVIPKKQLPPLVVSAGSRKTTVEADFLLLGGNGYARVVVEAKDPTKSVQDAWGQAAGYALTYNRDKTPDQKIQWLLISNGHITSLYRHDSDSPTITLQLSDFVSGSPPYVSLRSNIKYAATPVIETDGLKFGTLSPDKLNDLFKVCHNLIWKKEKLAPADAFYEFCKFMFIKIREDKKRQLDGDKLKPYELPLTIAWLDAQKATSKHPVRDILFKQLCEDLEKSIVNDGKKRIFEPHEKLNLSAETCRELIKKFQEINLSAIDDDLNGRMFEVFLNAAIRGKDLGQFFTPRPLVDFMTRIALYDKDDINNPPKVIDACCGTAGFLIEVMAYLTSTLRNDTRLNDDQKEAKKEQIQTQCLYGVEANERVSRIARINMYLHGDGGSHIFHGDGLDNDPTPSEDMSDEREREVKDHADKIKPDLFDIVLTNPPFSMSYSRENDDEERILRQLEIAEGLASVKSNVMFLQRYYDILKPDGEMLIVIDDTVLNGSTRHDVRKWILERFVVLGVHSMPFNAFFKARANIKTSVLHLRKKSDPNETQGHVFMSISNNIGHDNALNDTPERNNLTDILNTYFEWKRTGVLNPVVKENQDRDENLECPEQIWLTSPSRFTAERFDAFFYAPDLDNTYKEMDELDKKGHIKVAGTSQFELKRKLTRADKQQLKDDETKLKYIEIGDVTRYGLITSSIVGTLGELPTRGEYLMNEGDILMALNNSSRGTVVMVPKEFDNGICTSGFLVIKPKSAEEAALLWYALRSEYCRKQVYYLAQTASQPELKDEAWRKYFKIPLPTGQEKDKAIRAVSTFQSHVSALLDADAYRVH